MCHDSAGCEFRLQAYKLQQEKGALLVDCRVDWNFAQEHAEGAVSLPLFRGVTGNDLYATLKRIAMGSFAMKATGMNTTIFYAFRATCSAHHVNSIELTTSFSGGGEL